jgi:polygalacturonase
MRRVLHAEIFLLTLGWAGTVQAQVTVKACAVLHAKYTESDANQAADTARIQSALDECNSGKAVVLKFSGKKNAFVSAPLRLPRGVTLFIGRGVTLYASRNPRDYDLWILPPLVVRKADYNCSRML